MPRRPKLEAKIQQQLQEEDRDFILKYREFETEIRAGSKNSVVLPPTHEQLMRHSERKPISEVVMRRDISAVVNYHDWECKRVGGYVPLKEILTSQTSFYEYIQWKVNGEDQQIRSQTIICNGVLRMLTYMEEMEELDDEMKDAINDVRKTVRVLLIRAKSDACRHAQERPSVDELREKGEMLSFHDLIKVCKQQKWRVQVLLKNHDRSAHHRRVIEHMLEKEAIRLAVITMLLVRPLRKNEFRKLTIEKTSKSKHWRAKLTSNERKNRKPLNTRLSRKEKWVLRQLMPPEGNMWKPFKHINPTNILTKMTHEMTGVSMTIMDLRTAAESYADLDLAENKEIQDSLNVAEGHTRQTAVGNYSRNSHTNLVRPWKNHVEQLLYGEGCSNDTTLDKMIEGKLKESKRNWVAKIERKLDRLKEAAEQKQQKPRPAQPWTEEESDELTRCVKLYRNNTNGEIPWSRIIEASDILRKRYADSPDYRARLCLRSHWHWRLLKEKGEQNGRKGSKANRKVPIRRRRKKKKIPRKHKVVSKSAASETNKIFTVEKIIGYRQENGHDKYLIKWEGFNANHNSWEPSSNLNEAALEEAEEFQKQQNKRKKRRRVKK